MLKRPFPSLRFSLNEPVRLAKECSSFSTSPGARIPKTTHVDKVLNHVDRSVTGRHYDQYGYDQEKIEALTWWDRKLTAILANEGTPAGRTPLVDRSGVVELCCHPGTRAADFEKPGSHRRADELDFLLSPRFRELLRVNHARLVSYWQV